MRADVNLSVCESGSDVWGTRTEMKNLNSFKAITRAIEAERERQIELLEMGRPVIQETRRWDDNKESSRAMRSKEDAKDYRYFPDPDCRRFIFQMNGFRESVIRSHSCGKKSSRYIRMRWDFPIMMPEF